MPDIGMGYTNIAISGAIAAAVFKFRPAGYVTSALNLGNGAGVAEGLTHFAMGLISYRYLAMRSGAGRAVSAGFMIAGVIQIVDTLI